MTNEQIETIIQTDEFADAFFSYYDTKVTDFEIDGDDCHVYFQDEEGKHTCTFNIAVWAA